MRKESNNEFELKNNSYINKSYVRSVDGLRAISVSFVMLYHLMPHLFAGGYLGVLVFFVLSGYFVTGNLLNSFSQNEKFRLIDFYKERFFKIYLTYLPFLCIVSFMVLFVFQEALNHFLPNVISSLSGWNNIYQIINGLSYFETHGVLNPFTHLWFMGVELQFYLCFPPILFVIYKMCKGNRTGIGLFLFLLSAVSGILMFINYSFGQDISRVYYGTDTRAFSLLIGAYFSCFFPMQKVRNIGDKTWKNVFYSFLTVLLLGGVIRAMVVLDAQISMMYPFGMYLFSIVSAMLLILLMIRGNVVSNVLSMKVFSFLSNRSFSLYLWQYVVMVFVNAQFLWITIDPLLLVILNLLITFVISEISYQFLEKRRGIKYKTANQVVLRIFSILMLFAIGLPIYMPQRFEAQDGLNDLKRVIQEAEESSSTKEEEVSEENTAENLSTEAEEAFEKNTAENLSTEAEEASEKNTEEILLIEEHPADLQDRAQISEDEEEINHNKNPKDINQIIEDSQTNDDIMKKIFEEDDETKRRKEEERERELEYKRQLEEEQARREDEGEAQEQVISLRCTFIGDSVMLGSKANIQKVFPNSIVNAKVSRQAHNLRSILQDMESKGQLYENVIIHLGTNGSIDKQQLIATLQSIGDRNIYLINAVVPRSWESQVNQVIREVANELPNVREIDWHKAAKGKKELFYKDATHPELIGREKYTELIRNAIN